MDQQPGAPIGSQNRLPVERSGDLELTARRIFDAPPGAVFQAWCQPDLFRRWWVPQSASGISLVSCTMDVRTGGKYSLEFKAGGSDTLVFHGKYLEVVPDRRIVLTNDEGEDGAITTVTFEEAGGKTLLNFHEAYPSKEALEDALQGSAAALPEQLEQLAEMLSGKNA